MEAEGSDMLKSLLPSKFQYRVQEIKILEESEILEEQRFHASVWGKHLQEGGRWRISDEEHCYKEWNGVQGTQKREGETEVLQ